MLNIWIKCEPRLWSYIWFYTKNIYQIQKIRIKIWANFATYTNTSKVAWLKVEDECNNLFDISDIHEEAKTDFSNMGLVEFDIQIQSPLINNICKTCCK